MKATLNQRYFEAWQPKRIGLGLRLLTVLMQARSFARSCSSTSLESLSASAQNVTQTVLMLGGGHAED